MEGQLIIISKFIQKVIDKNINKNIIYSHFKN